MYIQRNAHTEFFFKWIDTTQGSLAAPFTCRWVTCKYKGSRQGVREGTVDICIHSIVYIYIDIYRYIDIYIYVSTYMPI